MFLYYDRVAKMFTLDLEEDVVFLGPFTQALLDLKKNYDLTEPQARAAVLQAYSSAGDGVSLDLIRRMY